MKFTLSWLKEHLETDADARIIGETLTLIGVTLPVSTPSTDTCAPEGNEVTFNEPFELSATALPGRSSSTPANTAIQTTFLGCIIKSSLNPSHDLTSCATLAHVVACFGGT